MKARTVLLVLSLAIYASCWGLLIKAAVGMKHQTEQVTNEYTVRCAR